MLGAFDATGNDRTFGVSRLRTIASPIPSGRRCCDICGPIYRRWNFACAAQRKPCRKLPSTVLDWEVLSTAGGGNLSHFISTRTGAGVPGLVVAAQDAWLAGHGSQTGSVLVREGPV